MSRGSTEEREKDKGKKELGSCKEMGAGIK